MKKFFAMILLSLASLCAVASPFETIKTVEIDGFSYELDMETRNLARLKSVPYGEKVVVVPDGVVYNGNEYKVVTTCRDFLKEGYSYIKELVLPSSLESLGTASFWNLQLENLIIPGSINNIPNMCFCFMKQLEDLTIESGVERIGDAAFSLIGGTVHIPATVKEFGIWSMRRIGGEIDYDFRNAEIIGGSAFNDSPLTRVEFSNGVHIGVNSFSNSVNLTEIVLPEEFTVDHGGAFSNCPNLTSVVVKATTPPECGYNYAGDNNDGYVIDTEVSRDCVLYVPQGCSKAYRDSKAWANFKRIEESDVAALDAVASGNSGVYEVWNLSGMAVASGCSREEAVAGLAPGVYILRHNGEAEKILLR